MRTAILIAVFILVWNAGRLAEHIGDLQAIALGLLTGFIGGALIAVRDRIA